MARHDFYRVDGHAGYLLDCQADTLSGLNTRFVVPLLPIDDAPSRAKRLNPVFEVEGCELMMATQYAASVPVNILKDRRGSLADQHTAIVDAIDMLITGV